MSTRRTRSSDGTLPPNKRRRYDGRNQRHMEELAANVCADDDSDDGDLMDVSTC